MPHRVLIADYKNADITARVPELFKKAGCVVDVFCDPGSWLLKNKYHDTWHKSSNANAGEYAKQLQSLVAQGEYDWIILGDDFVTRIMNDTITDDELARKILPLSNLAHRDILGSKVGLSVLANRYDITTPAYAVYDGISDPFTSARSVGFPLLCKVDRSGGGKGIFFCPDEKSFPQVWERIPESKQKNIVFQKYIKGDNISVEALYKNGALLGYATSKVLQNVRDEFSVSIVRDYAPQPEIEPDLEKIGEAIGINGFSSMTFMRDRATKVYYFVEADLRPHAWFSLAWYGGVDFSKVIEQYFSATPALIRSTLKASDSPCIVRHFPRELKWLIQHRDISGVLELVCNKNGCWRFIPWHDQRLFWSILGHVGKACVYDVKFLRPATRALKRWRQRVFSSVFGRV